MRAKLAKAGSNWRSSLACRSCSLTPSARAATCASLDSLSASVGLVGLTRSAITVAVGITWCNNSGALRRYLQVYRRQSCDIAARSIETGHEADLNGIDGSEKDDWYF